MEIIAHDGQYPFDELRIREQFRWGLFKCMQFVDYFLRIAGEPVVCPGVRVGSGASGYAEPARLDSLPLRKRMSQLERDECAQAMPEQRERLVEIGFEIKQQPFDQRLPVRFQRLAATPPATGQMHRRDTQPTGRQPGPFSIDSGGSTRIRQAEQRDRWHGLESGRSRGR